MILYYTIPYWIILYHTGLYSMIRNSILYWIIRYYTGLYRAMMYCTRLYEIIPQKTFPCGEGGWGAQNMFRYPRGSGVVGGG